MRRKVLSPLGRFIALSSGDARPPDLSAAQDSEYSTPVFGGNGVMGYAREANFEGSLVAIGRVGAYCGNVQYYEGKAWVTDNALYVSRWQDGALPRYFGFLLESLRLDRLRSASGQPLVSQKPILAARGWVPDAGMQRRIAFALSLIEMERAAIGECVSAKHTFKRGLIQQLLTGRRRFPEFQGRPWVRHALGDFFIEKSVVNSDRAVDLVYSCTKANGIVPQTERFGKRLASSDLARYKVVDTGDLVYDPMLLWDGSIGFVPTNGRGVVSPAYETFAVSEAANRGYFLSLLKSYNLIHRYKQISQGTNTRRRKAHPSDFLKTVVRMPPTKGEQDKIADVLKIAQREIDLLTALRDQIDLQKRGLLSKLLSGEIPVPA